MGSTGPVEGLPNNNTTNGDSTNNSSYTVADLAYLQEIEVEASQCYPAGKQFPSIQSLRLSLRQFADKKGFAIATVGNRIVCTRCDEPQHQITRRNKKAKPAEGKQRKSNSTRCGCPFFINYSPVDWRNRENKQIKITKSNYKHDNGCLPSRSQLTIEKRKAGCHTVAINEQRIKTILSVMETGSRVPVDMMRDLMRPLFPPGTSLDFQLVFNFRLKLKRMLASRADRGGNIDSQTITGAEEDELLATNDLDQESPEFLTEAFSQFQELLKEAMLDQNDLKQMEQYLDSMASCDPTFTYRIGHGSDGTVTGFIWQTGVMRRDFELFGDVIFVDRLGQPLNSKGWPYLTMAMLDGDKTVCLPSENLTITESVDSYAWQIRTTCEMTPKRKLSDIKMIFADGILAGETLLAKLGIQDTCHLVLDNHHLLSEDIGAWPKEFGLHLFSRLKEDLTTMVTSPYLDCYEEALSKVRSKLRGQPRFLEYLENNIHSKRHLFANHIVKTYLANQKLKGNAGAEANHSSIIQRIGRVVLAPAELVKELMKRHQDISAQRNYQLSRFHLLAVAEAQKTQDVSDKMAILNLSGHGLSLYRKAKRYSLRLDYTKLPDGRHQFAVRDNPDAPLIVLEPNANSCVCAWWIAFCDCQCSHLLLLKGGFDLQSWAPKYHQRKKLGISRCTATVTAPMPSGNHEHEHPDIHPFGCDDDISVESNTIAPSQVAYSQVSTSGSTTGGNKKLVLGDMIELTKELAYSINRVKDKDQQKLLLGAVVKLTEISKGNLHLLDGQSLETLLDNQLSLFTKHCSSQVMFTDSNKENYGMKRAALPDRSKTRLRSRNEQVVNGLKNSNKKDASCTICQHPTHKAGPRCLVVMKFQSAFIAPKITKEFAKNLGNPATHLVTTASSEDRVPMMEWLGKNREIPSSAEHLVIRRCFYTAVSGGSYGANPVEVTVLQHGGWALDGYEVCYFPAFKISQWIETNCIRSGRKKHILSCLEQSPPWHSQDVYTYSPGEN